MDGSPRGSSTGDIPVFINLNCLIRFSCMNTKADKEALRRDLKRTVRYIYKGKTYT